MLDASSLFDWAESTYPDLLNTHQTNQTHDIWTYRYYPNTDIYLGVNTHGDVLALVGKGDGTYDSVPLGKLGDYACLVNPGNCAETASKTVEGIHIHRTGMIGPFDPKMQIDGYKELCEGATAQALGIAEPFVLVGNPADLGATEQDEYYFPAQKMHATYHTTVVIEMTKRCRGEVVKNIHWHMSHVGANSVTHYDLSNTPDGKKWVKLTQVLPPNSSMEAFRNLLKDASFPGATVSGILGTQVYDGHQCNITDVTMGPQVTTLCMLDTGLPVPSQVDLSYRMVADGQTFSENHATKVELKAAIPLSTFYPPAGAPIKSF